MSKICCFLDLRGAEEEEAENASNASSNQDPAALADPFDKKDLSSSEIIINDLGKEHQIRPRN